MHGGPCPLAVWGCHARMVVMRTLSLRSMQMCRLMQRRCYRGSQAAPGALMPCSKGYKCLQVLLFRPSEATQPCMLDTSAVVSMMSA